VIISPIKAILVGTDLSWYARRAEIRAAMLASELGAEAALAMQRFVYESGAEGQIACPLEFGYAPTVIRERAEAIDPDLIAMGKHGSAEWESMLLGSVTKRVLQEAGCDVLVVEADQ